MLLLTNERELIGFTSSSTRAILYLLLTCIGGCASIPLATLGTVAGVTTSALSTGREVFTLGKLDTTEMAGYAQTLVATRRAADELYLKPKGPEKLKDFKAELVFVDEKGATIKVHVERRTEMMVRIRVDVGLFGSEVTAQLFLTRLRFHLLAVTAPQPQTRASTAPAPA
jgi:hypothetical protein